MRSSNSKIQGKVEAVNSVSPLENGLPPKEEEDDMGQNVRELAAKVVDNVVKMASEAAQQRTSAQNSPKTTPNKGCNLQKLPTIQIDTVPSAPSSPVDLTPPNESNEELVNEEPLNESDIQLDLDAAEQETESSSEVLRESLKSYVEDILSQAMVVAEKKLQFAGLPVEDDEEEEDEDKGGPSSEPVPSTSKPEEEEIDDSEIRAAAEKVVQEVITKASETVVQKLENGIAPLDFPGLPSIQIDTVKSAPPSPESEEEIPMAQKKWTFKVEEDSDSDKGPPTPRQEPRKPTLIKFDDAPEDVKEAATSIVKELVGRAIAMAEEKCAPTVPFNFEDVDLMKTSNPWYIRAREALIRLLRTACFCTPRRTDS